MGNTAKIGHEISKLFQPGRKYLAIMFEILFCQFLFYLGRDLGYLIVSFLIQLLFCKVQPLMEGTDVQIHFMGFLKHPESFVKALRGFDPVEFFPVRFCVCLCLLTVLRSDIEFLSCEVVSRFIIERIGLEDLYPCFPVLFYEAAGFLYEPFNIFPYPFLTRFFHLFYQLLGYLHHLFVLLSLEKILCLFEKTLY